MPKLGRTHSRRVSVVEVEQSTKCLYAIGIIPLVSVLVHGKVVSGSRRWFDLGAFHLQPSDLMKVLTIIALAKYIHDNPRCPESRRHDFPAKSRRYGAWRDGLEAAG